MLGSKHTLRGLMPADSLHKVTVNHRQLSRDICTVGLSNVLVLQMPLCLLETKIHNFRTFGNFFFYNDQGMAKKNLVCAGLLQAINAYKADRRELPAVLHWQLDNCPRDNKNHTVFGFVGHLIGRGVFSEALVCPPESMLCLNRCHKGTPGSRNHLLSLA